MKKIEFNGASEKIREFGKYIFLICLLTEIIFAADKRTIFVEISGWNLPLFSSIGILGLILYTHPILIKLWNVFKKEKSDKKKED